MCFSALQRAENSSIGYTLTLGPFTTVVSVLFSEPKIPQFRVRRTQSAEHPAVSVLFSEPKIPQFEGKQQRVEGGKRFSALQRAENSSTRFFDPLDLPAPEFQCSSASRKFLNASRVAINRALQKFQCSSASRKFLKDNPRRGFDGLRGFSALQRAENSSISVDAAT